MNDPNTSPDPEPDPRNQNIDGDTGMPAEFIDTPENEPGDQSPPNPATADDD